MDEYARRGPDGLTEGEREWRRLQEAEQLERRLVHEQRSAAEVPGFYMRTTIDDVVGKLFALRQRLSGTPPEDVGVAGRLDDLERLVDELVDVLIDPDAEPIDAGPGSLLASASRAVGFCSCGQPTLETN